ncbi:MAG: sugar phosphate isomerase/epimerase [Gemmatimonadales bacterium]|nr:sugar phosphate isomerase/epimerase [Gemmatimonadales bacterium]
MKTLALLRAAGGLPGSGVAILGGPPQPTARLQAIGIQLYSVRSEMARDFEGTLARLAVIGYQEVEFAGYFDRRPANVKSILERYGLAAPSAHVPIDVLRRDWARTLDAANIIGHRYIVVPWLPEEDRRTLDDYKRVADEFNRLGAEAKRTGIRLAYHNHDSEFVPVDGRLPYDFLLAGTVPALVAFELDLMWIAKGGRDPRAYFRRHPGRFEMVHVKDSTGAPDYRQVDVGAGTFDFRSIFDQHEQAGIRHAFVEHDNPADPLAFAEASYRHLKDIGLDGRPTTPGRRE